MSITINNAQFAFKRVQRLVVYQQANAPQYPAPTFILAPSTDTALPTYTAGRLLATYGNDAPNANLIGTLVNWDPASSVASQTIATHVLSDAFVENLPGIDLTNTATATATINRVACTPLFIGLCLQYGYLVESNSTAVMTAFNTDFTVRKIADITNTKVVDKIISIQGSTFL